MRNVFRVNDVFLFLLYSLIYLVSWTNVHSSQTREVTSSAEAYVSEPEVFPELRVNLRERRKYGKIQFSSNLESHRYVTLVKDLHALASIPIADSSGSLAAFFKIAATSRALLAWLEERVKYIVEDTFEVYKSKPSDLSSTLADNYGLALYDVDRQYPHLPMTVAKIPGVLQAVPITSPRVGIIRVYPKLFDSDLEKRIPLTEHIIRVSTLIHEARHSDRSGDSQGFHHILCPEGHEFQGLPVCDSALNGVHTMAALFLESAKEACRNCSPRGLERLKVEIADNLSRLIRTSASRMEDDTPIDAP